MDFLAEVLVDFCLFGLIEGVICCLILNFLTMERLFSMKSMILLSIYKSIVSTIFAPLIYQVFIVALMFFMLKVKTNKSNLKNILISIFTLIILVIIDIPYAIILDIFGIDLYNTSTKNLLMWMYPIKIFEILILTKGENIMKKFIWVGTPKKPAKPVRK